MSRREVDPNNIGDAEDWVGNNAAFTCPSCSKVFIVSQLVHKRGRECPKCGESEGHVEGGAKSGGRAWIEYPSLKVA